MQCTQIILAEQRNSLGITSHFLSVFVCLFDLYNEWMPLAKEYFEHIIGQEQFSKRYCHTWSQSKSIKGGKKRGGGGKMGFFFLFSITSWGKKTKPPNKKQKPWENFIKHKLLQYPLSEAILQAEIMYCRCHRMNTGREVLESDIKTTYAQKVSSQRGCQNQQRNKAIGGSSFQK